MNELNSLIFSYANTLEKIIKLLNKYPIEDYKSEILIEEYRNETRLIYDILCSLLQIIKNRDCTYKIISNFKDMIFGNETQEIDKFILNYQGIKISMFEASILSTSSYLLCTWSFYDSVQKLLLIILGCKTLNTSRSFNGDKSPFLNYNCFKLYNSIYREPYILSHVFRNFFIHEAGYFNGKSIYIKKEMRHMFLIDDSLIEEINKTIKKDKNIDKDILTSGNLIEKLKVANDKIDDFFFSILKHTMESFLLEIRFFLDNINLKKDLDKLLNK